MIVLQNVNNYIPASGLFLEHPGELRLCHDGRLAGLIAIDSKVATSVEFPLLGSDWPCIFQRLGLEFGQCDIPVLAPVESQIRGNATRLVISIPAGYPKSRLRRGIDDVCVHLMSLCGPVEGYDAELCIRLSMTLLALQDAKLELDN